MRYLLSLLFFIIPFMGMGQNITGFLKGDAAFIKHIERNFNVLDYDDTTSYIFTIAVVQFDSSGSIEVIKHSSEGYAKFKTLIADLIIKTIGMWDTAKVRNTSLLIPFELINYGSNDVERIVSTQRMLSDEFVAMFKNNLAIPQIILRPIILMRYGPHHRMTI